MKLLRFLLIFSIIYSCNGQENNGVVTYPKNKIMNTESFDVNNFKKYQEEQKKLPYGKPYEKITETNGTTITEYSLVSSKNGKEYGKEVLPPQPTLFYSLMVFNEKGKIKKSIDKVFLGILNFEYGEHNIYDENGYLQKTIDYTSKFNENKLKVDELLKLLEQEEIGISHIDASSKKEIATRFFNKNEEFTPQMVLNYIKMIFNETSDERGKFESKILNPYNRQDVERIRIDFDFDKKLWVIEKDFSSLGRIITLIDDNKQIIDRRFEL